MHEYAIGPLLEVVKGSVDDLECVKLAVFAVGTLSEVRIFESLMLLRLLLLLVVMVLGWCYCPIGAGLIILLWHFLHCYFFRWKKCG
jgi:hypothetical protein